MAYTLQEIKFIANEWWKGIPAKDKWKGVGITVWRLIRQGISRGMPMIALVGVKTARYAGIVGVDKLSFVNLWVDFSLIVGWILGWLMADIDNVYFALTCSSDDEMCQRVKREIDLKHWKSAWNLLESNKLERKKMPVRNAITGLLVAGLGIWVATSSASYFALGMVMGLSVRMFTEIIRDENYDNWYSLFSRKFTLGEHRGVLAVWFGALVFLGIRVVLN